MASRPDFLLIGAAKSGTSALYSHLAGHPEIFMSPVKEPNYFALEGLPASFRGPVDDDTINRRSVCELGEYLRLFRDAGDAAAVGEASTLYLYSPVAAEAIARFEPRMKILAMLRNPVDRAFSSYRHLVRDGVEKEPFAIGLEREEARISAGWSHIWHYTHAGLYARQIARFTERFPTEQIRVFTYDRFQADPEGVLAEIFGFLGVDPGHRADTSRRYNVSGRPRSKLFHRLVIGKNPIKAALRPVVPRAVRWWLVKAAQSWNVAPERAAMDPEIRARLAAGFADDVEELVSRLGLDLDAWKPSGHRS